MKIAAKTGTAELGVSKARVNSWVIGFFPYDKPRYAFAIVMDRGVRGNTTNASFVASRLFPWLAQNTPEYIGRDTPLILDVPEISDTQSVENIATTTTPISL